MMNDLTLYFDYAAATPMDVEVFAAMRPYFAEQFFNPSAIYLPAQKVRAAFEAARGQIGELLGAHKTDVIFTAGGTEANNLAIRGVLAQYPDGNVVVSAIEHESVLRPAHEYNCHEAAVTPDGLVDVEKLLALVNDQTVLVSVMYANNEVGTVQPIRRIAQGLQRIRGDRRAHGNKLPLYLHTDAAQAAAYLDLHVARLGVDMLTLNAGKIYGPKQCGVLFAASHVRLQPQILGGGQERGARSGTENVTGAIGLAKALSLVQGRRRDETVRLQGLQKIFIDELAVHVPNAAVNGSRKHRLPNNLHVTIPGLDNERALVQLEGRGILCATGSACSASSDEPSHVLRAMGLNDAAARSSLRLTMGRFTNETAVRKAVQVLADIAKELA